MEFPISMSLLCSSMEQPATNRYSHLGFYRNCILSAVFKLMILSPPPLQIGLPAFPTSGNNTILHPVACPRLRSPHMSK